MHMHVDRSNYRSRMKFRCLGLCCARGKVDLPPVARDETIELLWEDATSRKMMTKHARQLNNALALASSPAKKAAVPGSDWNPSVVIQGKLHHYIGPLNAADGERHTAAGACRDQRAATDLEGGDRHRQTSR